MKFRLVIMLLSISGTCSIAAPRPWKSADGSRSVTGDFVKRDAAGVTILRSDRKEVVIPMSGLHADDITWLNANHPLPGNEDAPQAAVFDQLVFGDTRAQVTEKLEASKLVQSTVERTFLGRTGLNGVFHTRKTIGGLDASLFFDWTEEGGLKEVTLQTESMPASNLNDRMVPCWKDLIDLLTTLHGKPISTQDRLDLDPIKDGGMSATHLWKLEPIGTAMLGAAREGEKYQLVVRFTREKIEPVIIPAGKQSVGRID